MLRDWTNLFVITGPTGAQLIGLLFVVVTLGNGWSAKSPGPGDTRLRHPDHDRETPRQRALGGGRDAVLRLGPQRITFCAAPRRDPIAWRIAERIAHRLHRRSARHPPARAPARPAIAGLAARLARVAVRAFVAHERHRPAALTRPGQHRAGALGQPVGVVDRRLQRAVEHAGLQVDHQHGGVGERRILMSKTDREDRTNPVLVERPQLRPRPPVGRGGCASR